MEGAYQEEGRDAISNMWLNLLSVEAAFAHAHTACSVTHWMEVAPVVLVVVVLCCPLQKVLQTSDELVIAEHSHTARKAPHVTTM